MDYSIIIPVFNKAHFTKHCLETLRAGIEGAGDGEIIVVDNASSDETPELLKNYPWIRVIRNEKNLGFAGANNQAARVARGEFLVLLNNDTEGFPGWLEAMLRVAREPGVGAVGAKLLFPDRTVQHAGVVTTNVFLSRVSMTPFHYNYRSPGDAPRVNVRGDVQAVTGACLVTPRAVYSELGGLDEVYWNGYEDVDYCFKLRARGLRVIYEPAAQLFHFESQSGIQRFRKALWNCEILEERWRGKIAFDANEADFAHGRIRRPTRAPHGTHRYDGLAIPETTVIVHGGLPAVGRDEFERRLRANTIPIQHIAYASEAQPIAAVRQAMEVRGSRYLVLVDSRAQLEPGWLDALAGQVESTTDCAAGTAVPELPVGENVSSLAADARCTLLSLVRFPQHMRLEEFDTLDGAVADLLLRMVELERGTRGVPRAVATLPPVREDESFERAHGIRLQEVFSTDPLDVEHRLRQRVRGARGLVSIVTLSWNAVEYTKLALDSIRRYTTEPYEVICVDNGSREDTVAYLRSIDDPHVRVIYNPENRGYGGGNNIGMAAARGEHVVILNNDVIVTEGWLDGLLDPFDRIPGLGVTAPRSNRVAGSQQVGDAQYNDEDGIQQYARERRERWKRSGYITERAIGLCLCVDRRVIDEVGGFDERFGLGNFEDDDWAIRIRAAGYGIYVCDDAFIHHFGSRSFVANNVDYEKSMRENWAQFAEKWGYTGELGPNHSYDPRNASLAGFNRALHYAPLPQIDTEIPVDAAANKEPASELAPEIAFVASVRSEDEWGSVAEFVKRFARAYRRNDPVALFIASFDNEPYAETIGTRIERFLRREGIDPEEIPWIDVSDEDDENAWRDRLKAVRVVNISQLEERSPSSLRRLLNIAV